MQKWAQPTLTKFQPMVTVAWFHSTPLTNHRTESGLREFSCKIANQRKGIYVPLYCFLLKSSKSNEMEWMSSRDVVYANFFFALCEACSCFDFDQIQQNLEWYKLSVPSHPSVLGISGLINNGHKCVFVCLLSIVQNSWIFQTFQVCNSVVDLREIVRLHSGTHPPDFKT